MDMDDSVVIVGERVNGNGKKYNKNYHLKKKMGKDLDQCGSVGWASS